MDKKLHEEPHNIPGARHPEIVYCLGKSFLSRWAESALREQLAVSKQALETIALSDTDEDRAAREAIIEIDAITF